MKQTDLIKEYETFLENNAEQAPEEVRTAYNKMREAFENYLCAVEEQVWKQGFKHAAAKFSIEE